MYTSRCPILCFIIAVLVVLKNNYCKAFCNFFLQTKCIVYIENFFLFFWNPQSQKSGTEAKI